MLLAYRDYQIGRGEREGQPHVQPGEFQTHSDVPSLDKLLDRDYPPYTNAIPDVLRADIFLKEFKQYEESGKLPNLVTLQLNTDHTSGTARDLPTPRAQVADNDLALGRVVESISRSRYWKDSAIFVIEDDTQAGLDHVDGHRTPAYVISPWVKRDGSVDSTFYTQIDMVRTIEQILGLPPMNQMDLAATPMRTLFTAEADTRPYEAAENRIALDELNPGSTPPTATARQALSPIQKEWADASDAMGFDDPDAKPDENDENKLNRAIWYGTKGFATPYPGDRRVLRPGEVKPAEGHDSEADGKGED